MKNTKVRKWLKKAALQGLGAAQLHIGLCYELGEGLNKNMDEAVHWYQKVAEQGIAAAQFQLAICYATGKGVEKNADKTIKWLRKAAEQGHEEATDILEKAGY